MDNNNQNNTNPPTEEKKGFVKGFADGFTEGVTNYLGAVGSQVTGVWAKSSQLWNSNHKVLAVANTVICTPIMTHVAPITGIFAMPEFEQLTGEVKNIHDEEMKKKCESAVRNAKIVGGLIAAGAILGITAKAIKSARSF